MLRRLFSSANMVGGSGSPSSPACSAPSNSADKVPRSSRTRDDLSGFLQLVSRLDDFEGSLKVTVNMLSRHCQAIVEMMSSSRDLDIGIQELYHNVESATQQKLEREISTTVAVTEFRNSHIAPLQALLAEIPQLKVFCEHRNSALNVVLRYEAKIADIQSTTRYESARLQRNRSKLQSAIARFKEIDENVRSEIARVLAKDIAELLGDSLEKVLLETQLTAAKQLQIDAQDLQKRIKSYSALAGQKKIVASTDTTDPEAPGGHPEESTSSSEADTTQHEQVPFALTQPPLIEPNISSIQLIPKTVLNEQHSVCPQKKYVHGTRTWNLHRHAKDSMTTGLDVTECIQLPDGYQLEEWVAVHVIDFFNEVSLLFGTISEFCTVDSCSQMTAGPCYTYLWANGKQQTAPTSLPAPEYVSCLMNWVQDQLDDPQVFPPDGRYECNPTFLQDASVIFKRLFRVYAHMYHSHLEDYVALHAESHLNFCFKRFIFFVKEFHMIDQKELNALRKLIQTLVDPPMHLRA